MARSLWIQCSRRQSRLQAGTYQGTITVTAASLAGSPMNIQVTLIVTAQPAQPALAVAVTRIAFQAIAGQNPTAQNLAISNTGGGILTWTAAAVGTTGGNWLTVSPASGTGNATIQLSAAAASLPLGPRV